MAFTLTLVTTRPPQVYRTEKAVYEYRQISRQLFWGYKEDGRTSIAEPEKAPLDLIYLRAVRGKELSREALSSLLDDMYLEEIDRRKLEDYARHSGPAMQRLLQHHRLT